MNNNSIAENGKGDIVIYQSENGDTKIDVHFQDETVWLTQAQLCELYQRSKANVSEHIKNIFAEGELDENNVGFRCQNRDICSLYCEFGKRAI